MGHEVEQGVNSPERSRIHPLGGHDVFGLGRRLAALVLVLTLLALSPSWGIPRKDPQTGRLRVLYIGTAFWGTSPGRILLLDPKLDPTLVPIITIWYTEEENARYMRLYMPRNYEDLVTNKDLIHLAGCDAVMITPRWQNDLSRAVVEDGLGLLMTDGHRGFGGASAQQAEWKGTKIEQEILPVDVYTNQFVEGPITIRILDPTNALMASLPWATAPTLTRLNKLTEKKGSVKLADDGREGFPVICYWNLEKGRSTIFATDLHGHYAERWVKEWIYWHDFVLNLIYYSCGADVPSDPEVMHAIRQSLYEYSVRVALLRDMMGFIEKFGANPAVIDDGLGAVDDQKRMVDRLYLQQAYAETLEGMDAVISSLSRLEEKAVAMKDRALQWIYLTEWFVIWGTCMLIGALLWTLMVRKKLYREIGTTRAVSPSFGGVNDHL